MDLDRPAPGVDDLVVGGVEGDVADVAFQDALPVEAGVAAEVGAVEGDGANQPFGARGADLKAFYSGSGDALAKEFPFAGGVADGPDADVGA